MFHFLSFSIHETTTIGDIFTKFVSKFQFRENKFYSSENKTSLS
jgi:hypothetical protein